MTGGTEDTERIGPLLARLRRARGLSQGRLAKLLCDVSGTPTVGRHEVSRWERGGRVPGALWRQWLAAVLDASLEQLNTAAAATRLPVSYKTSWSGVSRCRGSRRLWRPPDPAVLLATLDHADMHDVGSLAHAWLAGPSDPPLGSYSLPTGIDGLDDGTGSDLLDARAAGLSKLRRADDVVGGLDLAGALDVGLRETIRVLRVIGHGALRRRALRQVASHAQLAGWVHADAGNAAAARRAYEAALHAAAASGDRLMAAHVLGSLSYQSQAAGETDEALLLAHTALTGISGDGCPLLRVLLLHRAALAAARCGQRQEAERTLVAAERAADRCVPVQAPKWLYWLDGTELTAMTGRCLAMLGRPLRAVPRLAHRGTATGPRTATIYDVWLARSYLRLGEAEQACQIAVQALPRAISTGSARAVAAVRRLHPLLLRHYDIPAIRDYEQLADQVARRVPDGTPRTVVRGTDAAGGVPRCLRTASDGGHE